MGLTGIGFGVANFVKYGSNNKGTGYGDSLEIQLQFALNNPTDGTQYTDQDYINQTSQVAKKVTLLSDLLGVDNLQVQSGIQKDNESSSNTLTIGNVTLHTNTKFLYYDFSSNPNTNTDLTLEEVQALNDENKLSLYYELTHNNNYYLENVSTILNKNNSNDNNNFDNVYHLNNVNDSNKDNITKAYKSNDNSGKLLFDLRQNSNSSNNEWDFSKFQNQFTNVYSWDGSTSKTRQEVISAAEDDPNSSVSLTDPEQSYILFTNRNGLISLLQNLTTISYLEQMSNKGLDVGQLKRVQALYDKVAENPEYKSFME
ncbi:hypothetical protein IKD48_01565 [bacterium]|nr:hypothetical protein [bacterium]